MFHDASKKPPELAQAAVKYAEQNGLTFVIVDTAGRLQIDDELMRELEQITSKVSPDETLLVADAMTGQEAVRVAEGFLEHVALTGVILTKMDGDARGGAALSLREVTGVPIKFVGTGEKLDALEQFHPDRIAQRILGMGDVMSLIERAQEHVDQEQAAKMQSKVVKGEFDLQDFLEQMSQLRKMAGGGGLTGLVEMLPGVGRAMKEARQAGQAVDEQQFKRIEAIIQSMTLEERRRPRSLAARASDASPAARHLRVRDQPAAGAVPPDAGHDEAARRAAACPACQGHGRARGSGRSRRRDAESAGYGRQRRGRTSGDPGRRGATGRQQSPASQGAQEEEAPLAIRHASVHRAPILRE